MNSVQMLSSVLGLAFASGVNLYAAVLVVGLGIRFGWLSGLPGDLHYLASPVILIAAGVMYFLEFFADKIPYVSVAWDSIHTFIRPLGGAALALASAAKLSPEMQGLAMLAGGSVALGAHSTKMGYRLIAHASPEPVSDSIFSLAEDFGVVGLVLLIYKHPQAALAIVIALICGIAIFLPLIARVLGFFLSGIRGRVVSWFQRDVLSDPAGIRCFARKIPKAPRMQEGYLILSGGDPQFKFRHWFRQCSVPVKMGALQQNRGLLFDVVNGGAWSVYLTKDVQPDLAGVAAQVTARHP